MSLWVAYAAVEWKGACNVIPAVRATIHSPKGLSTPILSSSLGTWFQSRGKTTLNPAAVTSRGCGIWGRFRGAGIIF